MSTRRSRIAALAIALGLLALSGCGDGSEAKPSDYADQLKARMSTDALMAHLQRLQAIADANGGTRQTGTPGYDASVDYVVKLLRDKGFDVQTPEFDVGIFHVDAEKLVVAGAPVAAAAIEFSGSSPGGGVTGPLIAAPMGKSMGCLPTDFDGMSIEGAVVLVDRGDCILPDKVAAAKAHGAVGLVIANNSPEKAFSAAFGATDGITMPVVWVSTQDGARLRTLPAGRPSTANLVVDARVEHRRSRSVVAQTRTGSTDNVVLVGAHLDSVRLGPGIDDDGSGVAAVLETAVQMGSSPPVKNAVRFALWGGEEEFLVGSTAYVKSLALEPLRDIALYLNFDMIGSPNPGYLTLDGDVSTPPDPDLDMSIPGGSAGIEHALVDYLKGVGHEAEDLPFDGRGDYAPFAATGIPVGALSTGDEEVKSPEQAAKWGGQAGQAFDPNYHSADDVLANVNRAALDITGPAVAFVVGHYASDQSGNYGVPARSERARHLLENG
jgi:Zn-dependent M28 family amino/carboxypeptidase